MGIGGLSPEKTEFFLLELLYGCFFFFLFSVFVPNYAWHLRLDEFRVFALTHSLSAGASHWDLQQIESDVVASAGEMANKTDTCLLMTRHGGASLQPQTAAWCLEPRGHHMNHGP